MFLRPPDDDAVYEFYSPFAHIEGRYEWCRIRSATHGVFDTFIILGKSTAVPATVYVNSVLGERFMQERYPECRTIRVAPGGLAIHESNEGMTVQGTLESEEGPVRQADMTLNGVGGFPEQVSYGGTGEPVWGSKFTCWGVDLVVRGKAEGYAQWEGGRDEVTGLPCVITLGSFGRIASRA